MEWLGGSSSLSFNNLIRASGRSSQGDPSSVHDLTLLDGFPLYWVGKLALKKSGGPNPTR